VIDFEAEGLLDGLDGRAREARVRLLERLSDEGVSLEKLREAVAEGTLFLLPAERMLGGDARYTGTDIAEHSGLSVEFLLALRRAHGLPVSGPDTRIFTEGDLESAKNAAAFRDAGLDPADMLTVTRILGRGLSQAAEAMRAMTLKLVLQRDADEEEIAVAFADAVGVLTPMTAPMVGQMLNLHLRHLVRTELMAMSDRTGDTLPRSRDVAVAFADLVGFTRMGEEVEPGELGRVAGRLEDLTSGVVEPPVKLVKTIGDAVMLVSPEVDPLLDVCFGLVDAADAEGETFPQLRAGIAMGPALQRAGDWFGHPVNLASRITGVARPASVLVGDAVREAATDDGRRWSFAGERKLKGIREPVRLFRARADTPTPAEAP